jgi:para-aminobenzoate synthetase component 1
MASYSLIEPLGDLGPPEEVFRFLRRFPYSFFLDSSRTDIAGARYSFLGADPYRVIEGTGSRCRERDRQGNERTIGNPMERLREMLEEDRREGAGESPFPFSGGALGYLAYDCAHLFERLPRRARRDVDFPDLLFGFHDAVLVYDHKERKWHRCRRGRNREREPAWLASLDGGVGAFGKEERGDASWGQESASFETHFSPEAYRRAVGRALDHIRAGDIYQVNLSQRFRWKSSADPYEVYLRLRRASPVPFSAFLEFPGRAILSLSPERFLELRGRRVRTGPIKGTRPRSADPSEDLRLKEELWSSPKDNAELVMIVDLERNDLGRVCRYGSVVVPEAKRVESYASVHHLVAAVEGELAPNRDRIDLLAATFPGGSITGAPKIRAMEIIDALEPSARSVYTGAIGYLGFDGGMELNIAIRTALWRKDAVEGGEFFFWAGGGIVAESDPELEYRELLAKGEAFLCLDGGSRIQPS